MLFERLCLLIYDILCAFRLYLMNCAIEGNGNANLFLASRDVHVVCVCVHQKVIMFYLHHERYFEVISSS